MSEAAKSFVDIRTVEPGSCPSPPMLPSSVPSHIKSYVDQAAKAAKMAWLIESQRANFTGGEISDEQLNKTYKLGRQWYSRHATTPDLTQAFLPLRINSHTHLISLSPGRRRLTLTQARSEASTSRLVEVEYALHVAPELLWPVHDDSHVMHMSCTIPGILSRIAVSLTDCCAVLDCSAVLDAYANLPH